MLPNNPPLAHAAALSRQPNRSGCLRLFVVLFLSTRGALIDGAEFQLSVDGLTRGKAISPQLVGIFFEDLNYAADGGIYAELIQNRSFEYSETEQVGWGPLTGWNFVKMDGGTGDLWIDSSGPLHPNNPHSALLQITSAGGGVGLANGGFDGISVTAGETYVFSVFTRLLQVGPRQKSSPSGTIPLTVRLETKAGAIIAETTLEASSPSVWKRLEASLVARCTVDDARLILLANAPGLLAIDVASLFPKNTFKGRRNGLRADLAQTIADLRPKFMRFPGGCLVHGDGLPNMYRWKETIGPIEQRKAQPNIWRYHQSVGLGYFEYFQFCEDIGALPIPVVAAGVSCQNSTRTAGTGQQAIALEDMPAYVQDVLDLVDYAKGPISSSWGAKRAEAGHPAPFDLRFLGIGNEDKITPEFTERFSMIAAAVRKKHPEIEIIGTVGPAAEGEDYDRGWRLAKELNLPLVDEHYYQTPAWFWQNLSRYDSYPRGGPKVYLGEYAAHDVHRRSTLRSALAEAAYLTALERNADVVRFASYAPLLGKRGHTQWSPNLLYFDNRRVFPTLSYVVQQLFSLNAGESWVYSRLTDSAGGSGPADLVFSTVRTADSGALIIKIVNGDNASRRISLDIRAAAGRHRVGTRTTLAFPDETVANTDDGLPAVPVVIEPAAVPSGAEFELAAHSLTVFRLPVHP